MSPGTESELWAVRWDDKPLVTSTSPRVPGDYWHMTWTVARKGILVYKMEWSGELPKLRPARSPWNRLKLRLRWWMRRVQ